jgi:hypothetical protein
MGSRYVGLGKETIFRYGAAATRYLEAVASIKPNQNWVIPPPIASRAMRKRNLGPWRSRGTIGDFPVEPENIGELLLGAFGSVTTTTPYSGVKLHTFTPADTLPSWALRLGVEQCERRLYGSLIESLTIKFPHDKDLMANAEVYSAESESRMVPAIGTPTISALQAFVTHGDVGQILNIGGTPKRDLVYDLELTIKNNIPFERGDLSGRYFSKIRTGQRQVTGKLSMYFDDMTEYDRFMAGTDFTLLVSVEGPAITGAYHYYIEFELRKCVYLSDSSPDVQPQNEPLVINAPFQAFYDTSGGFNAEAKAKLQNTITSY